MAESIWARFAMDPRSGENAHLRASDQDRDVVHDVLATAYADGRLSAAEHEERSDRVLGAKTLGELPSAIDDLVPPAALMASTAPSAGTASAPVVLDRRAEAELRYRRQRQQALMSFLTPTLICWVIYLATMAGGFPWPLFVMIGTGLHFVRLATTKEDSIRAIEQDTRGRERRRSQRQERRELG